EEDRPDSELVRKPGVARLQEKLLRFADGVGQADSRFVALPLERGRLRGAREGRQDVRENGVRRGLTGLVVSVLLVVANSRVDGQVAGRDRVANESVVVLQLSGETGRTRDGDSVLPGPKLAQDSVVAVAGPGADRFDAGLAIGVPELQ